MISVQLRRQICAVGQEKEGTFQMKKLKDIEYEEYQRYPYNTAYDITSDKRRSYVIRSLRKSETELLKNFSV